MHRETREMPVYNLVFARADKRLGAALKETSAECRATIAASIEAAERGGSMVRPAGVAGCETLQINPGILSVRGALPALIGQLLSQAVGRPVIDKTSLTGLYDFTLTWAPAPGGDSLIPFGLPPGALPGGPPAPTPLADPDAADLFTALQEQLGLKLESGRGPVEVVVIDGLEKPMLD